MIEVLLTSSVLILALALLRLFGTKVSARLRYALWALVLVRLLLPAGLIHSPVSVMNAAPTLENLSVERVIPDVPPAVDPVVPAPASSVSPVVAVAPPAVAEPIASPAAAVPPPVDWSGILKWVWLAGACAVGGYFLLSNLLFYRRLRLSAERRWELDGSLPVYEADFLPSPCMAGLLRPAIYLNAAALRSEEGLRHVLAHETCHKRHGDNWWALARCLCLALWWFDPLVWLAAYLSRRDCELACDESALKLLGEEERIPYGKTLVGLTVRPAPADLLRCSTAMTASGKALKERIKNLAMNKRMSKALLSLVLAAALTLGFCTFTSALAALPGAVGVEEYSIRLPDGSYTRNSALYNDRGNIIVNKEEWDTTLKEVDPSLVTVSYPTASETERLISDVSESWAVAFGQQFYHLAASNPCRADNVEIGYAYPIYTKYHTPSGGSRIINSTTVSIWVIFHPAGSMEKAVEHLGGYCNGPTGNSAVENSILVPYQVTLTRKVKANGTTTWSCTGLEYSDKLREDTASRGNYSPTALPVTVAPKEGWQLSELDSAILAVPDLGWNPRNEDDRRELEIRAAMAYAQEYYALKPGHPYRASEVRVLQGDRGNLIIAVKPVDGVEAVEPYFKGTCPKGVGDLEGFVLLNYSFSASKMVIESFGDKPVYAVSAGAEITVGPARFNINEFPTMTADDREYYESDTRPWGIYAEGTGQEGRENAVGDFAASYAAQQNNPFSNQCPSGSYYEVKVLDAKLTGWSEGGENQVVSGTMTYAFLPIWGAEAAMAFHPGQCTLGTGDLKGYVIRTIPVFYLQLTEEGLWECAGLCTTGDGKSESSVWLSEIFLEVDPLTAPPAGVTWVTAD